MVALFDEDFARFARHTIEAGQSTIADMGRELVRAGRPDLADLLDGVGDAAFLEPLLFAFFTRGAACPITLDQLLFEHIPGDRRPSTLPVGSDEAGLVFLPGHGTLRTALPARALELTRDSASGALTLRCGADPVELLHDAPLWIDGTSIELHRDAHPLLGGLFTDPRGEVVAVDVAGPAQRRLPHLAAAFEIIRRTHPLYRDAIDAVTRRICLFQREGVSSFASLAAHGTAFMSVEGGIDEVSLIEDIAHQCGHLVFSAMTFERGEFLFDPDTPLREITGAAGEPRTVYSAFHDVFTGAVMCQCLARCCDQALFSGRQAHEIEGRLAFLLRRLGGDLADVTRSPLFTAQGEWLLGVVFEVLREAYDRFGSLVRSFDLSNQPPSFSYARLLERNPRREPEQPESDAESATSFLHL